MKAIVYTKYGSPDVLQFKEVEKPVPKNSEILVKIQAASVNTLDLSMRGPLLARIITGGLLKPKDPRLGADIAGRVEAVGTNVIHFKLGVSKGHLFQFLLQALLLGPVISRTGRQKMGFMGIAKINQKDLVYVKELLEVGKVVPVIDRRYPLSQTTEALMYLEEGHARGKVVITVDQNDNT